MSAEVDRVVADYRAGVKDLRDPGEAEVLREAVASHLRSLHVPEAEIDRLLAA